MDSRALISLFRGIRVTSYLDVSSATLFVFDYMLTLEMEIDLVWRTKWNFIKCLYLIQRYLPFIDSTCLILIQKMAKDLSTTDCLQLYSAIGWLILGGIVLSEMLLSLRVWAVWQQDRRVTIILPALFGLFWLPTIAYMILYLRSLKFGEKPYPSFEGCFLVEANDLLLACFATLMAWDIVILIFILIPGWRAYEGGGNTALFSVIYSEGIVYYLYLVVFSCLNVIIIKTFPPGYDYILLSLERCIHSILASRVLLHIRVHCAVDEDEVPSLHIESVHDGMDDRLVIVNNFTHRRT